MRQLLTTLVILTGLFCSAGAVWAQDYKKGLKAFRSDDFATALKEWRPLAEQGDAKAQSALGYLYRSGKGVTQDHAKALQWYRKSAEQGYAFGQNSLGLMYDKGRGVTQDYAEAVKWYRTAAEQGLAVAQHNLGLMLARGSGVLQDIGGAHVWLNIAAANGFSDAIGVRDALAKKLSDEQLQKANKRAKRCMDADYKDCDAEAKSWWEKLKD